MRHTRAASMLVVFGAMIMVFISFFIIVPFGFNYIFMIVFILPFLMVFLLATLGISKTMKQHGQNTVDMTTCPQCFKATLKTGAYCSHCGKALSKPLVCDYCGASNKAGAVQCENCNALL